MRHSRRKFLIGAGGVAVALPWLEKLDGVARAQAAPSTPKRVIVVGYSMGVPLRHWVPDAGFNLPYVTAPLEPFKDRCLFVSNIDHLMLEAGGGEFVHGHPAKHESALTGTLTTGAFPVENTNHLSEIRPDAVTDGAANAPSIEHIIGQQLMGGHPMPSVNLGVDGYAGLATWGPPDPTASSWFFFEGPGNAITLDLHPDRSFDRLFSGLMSDGPSEADLVLQRLRARNASVLDAVRASFDDLKQGLGRQDRIRLEEHAARIRQLELDVQLSATCSAPTGIGSVGDYSGYSMDQLAPLQIRNLVHAMTCDMAPVGRLEFVNQQNPRFGIADLDSTLDAASVDGMDWHGMVHGDPIPGTTNFLRPGRDDSVDVYDPRLLDGYRFFVEQFAYLLQELERTPEGEPGQTALDHSMVILASDLGEGLGHGNRKMGYILAGNLGTGRTGYHYDAAPGLDPVSSYYTASNTNVNQLLNSILDMAGVVDPGGGPVTMGLQGWLEAGGLPRRIDGLFG